MLNCVVPRGVLDAVRMRFGSVFSSISPDWNFAYRALEVVDSLLYFHKANWFIIRSPEAMAGVRTSALETVRMINFLASWRLPVNFKAPYPEIITVWNALIHEYCSVREEAQSKKISRTRSCCLQAESCYRDCSDRRSGSEVRHGDETKSPWRETCVRPSFARKLASPRSIGNKVKLMLTAPYETASYDTADQALEAALTKTRPRSKSVPWEEALHEGVEVPIDPN